MMLLVSDKIKRLGDLYTNWIAPGLIFSDDEERVYRTIRRMTLGTALYR
ncbi:hypothetical protein [Enterococcus sp. AZ194]